MIKYYFLIILLALTGKNFALAPGDIERLVVREPSPLSSDVTDITSRGEIVIAVTNKGEIAMSQDDGASWSAAAKLTIVREGSTIPLNFSAITSSDDIFLAVSEEGYWARSSDLVRWEKGPLPFESASDVTFAEGLFLATSFDGTIATSSDRGNTWAIQNLPNGVGILNSVTHGDGVFVAVGSNKILSSLDSVSWTANEFTLSQIQKFLQVSYVNGLFLAGGPSSLLYTSPDGVTWTSRNIGRTGVPLGGPALEEPPGSITLVNGGRFHQLSATLDSFTTSTHPFFATAVTRTTAGSLISGGPNALLRHRPAGSTEWIDRLEKTGSLFQIIFAKDLFLAFDKNDWQIFSSSNGVDWAKQYQGDRAFISKPVFNGDIVATLDRRGNFISSSDGLNWTINPTGLSTPILLKFLNGKWIIVMSTTIAESTDGISWTEHPVNGSTFIRSITFGEGLYVAVDSDTLLTSPDLITWTARTVMDDTNSDYSKVEFGNGRFMLFPLIRFDPGIPALSEDGLLWEKMTTKTVVRGEVLEGFDDALGFYSAVNGEINYWPADSDLSDPFLKVGFASSGRLNSFAEGNGTVVGAGFPGLLMSLPVTSAAYNSWAEAEFGEGASEPITGFRRDPDDDGLSNLEEYARGTDPNSPSPPLTLSIQNSQVSFSQRANLDDLFVTIEYSSDLKTWFRDGVTRSVSDPVNGQETVTGTAPGTPLLRFFRAAWDLNNQ